MTVAHHRAMGEQGEGPRIVEAELVRVAVPLVAPLVSAHGREDRREVVLVRVVSADGVEGWGECSALARPTYTAEYTAGAWAVLRDELVPSLLAGAPSGVVGHPMAAAAVEGAVLDARLRADGVGLAVHLAAGGEVAAAVPTAAVLGRGPVDELLPRVAAAVASGSALVKLKVSPAEADLQAVEQVRGQWPDLPLAVDWNGCADLASLQRLDRLRLAYVEQPAPAEDLLGSARFASAIGAPVALDESVVAPGHLAAALSVGAGTVLNLKPARVGGVGPALHLVDQAREAGMEVFVGGMLETGVGRATALAVAAQTGGALPTDLGPSSRYLARELTEPIELDGRGRLVVPSGPGIGVVPDPARLAEVTVDRWVAGR